MIFIVDGPDGAGKSLLCHTLQKKTGYKVEHLTQPEKYGKLPTKDLYENLLQHDNVIFNRFYYSEIIYSNVKNRRCGVGPSDCEDIDRLIKEKKAVVIHVTADIKILKKRIQKRGDDFINFYELERIKTMYDFFMEKRASITINMNLSEDLVNGLLGI